MEVEEEEDQEDVTQHPISNRTRSKFLSFDETKNVTFPQENQTEDLQKDVTAAYYINIAGKENLEKDSVYRVEIPAKQHGRPDVLEAKKVEMGNLTGHNTWSEVPYMGPD